MTQKQKIIALVLFVLVAAGLYFLISFYEGARNTVTDTSNLSVSMPENASTVPANTSKVVQPTPSTPDAIIDDIVSDAKNDPVLNNEVQGAQSVLNDDASSTNSYDTTYENQEF